MLQIRHQVFETNSSSTHCLVVPRFAKQYPDPATIDFRLGQFKWGHNAQGEVAQQKLTTLQEKANYLWTAIVMGLNADPYNLTPYGLMTYDRGLYDKEGVDTFVDHLRQAFPKSKLTFQYLTAEEKDSLGFGGWQDEKQKYLISPLPGEGFYNFFSITQNLRNFLLDEQAVVEISDEKQSTPSEILRGNYESIPTTVVDEQNIHQAREFLELIKDNLVLPLDDDDGYWPSVQEPD